MLFKELLEEEKEEGRTEGRTEGRIEGKAEAIVDLLSDLGTVSEELREKILGEKNFDTLRSYLRKAATAKTIEEFETLIKE